MLIATSGVSGCSSSDATFSSALSSAGTAAIASGIANATGSAAVGAVAGFGAGVGLDIGIKYAARRIHRNVQDAVADAAGPLKKGQAARWDVTTRFPLSERHGTLQIARSFGAAIPCKDIVFTVDDDDSLYVTTVCQNKKGIWQWALAEPTTDRWGSLQ